MFAAEGAEIFGPFIGMLVLTLVVWVVMYVRRLHFIIANRVDPQRLTTPERGMQIIPEEVSYPSNNLKNLFELPVLFYALCLYLYVTDNVDAIYVGAAWVFLGFRVLHSWVHCTRNIVRLRFGLYAVASVALWFMVIRAVIAYL